MLEDLLRQAISAIKEGDKARGRQLLIQVLEQDPKNETAWLWMSKCVAPYEHKKECFNRVLRINPNNPYALEGLKRLEISKSNATVPKLSQPIPSSKYPKKKKTNTVLLASIFGIILLCSLPCIIFFLISPSISSTNVNTYATNVPIIINVPSLFGKSLSEIRATYRVAPYEDIHPLLGYEDILPNGRLSEGYSDRKYSFYIFYNEKQEAVGFQIYDGLESHNLRVSDWREITQMLNLNVTQPPDFISDYRVEWNSVSGYHIEIIRNITGEYVFAVIVVESR